jgi:hypothetical protein
MAEIGRFGAEKTGLCVPASLDLHSPGKGANKTPPVCVASDLPQAGCDRSVRRPNPTGRGAVRSAGGMTGKTDKA